MWICLCKEFLKLRFRAWAFCQSAQRNCRVVWFTYWITEVCYLWKHDTMENIRISKWNEKHLLMPCGFWVLMQKDTFFVEEFGGFLNLLNLWKGSRLPYVALNYLRDLNVYNWFGLIFVIPFNVTKVTWHRKEWQSFHGTRVVVIPKWQSIKYTYCNYCLNFGYYICNYITCQFIDFL